MSDIIPKDAYVMIIGAMKCGTSSLYHLLNQHPEICPASRKEAEYFSENQGRGADVEKYEDLWDFDSTVHKYVIEASTGYTKYSSELHVPRNIRDYGINPKFIYIIRDPFDRIESQYNFLKNKNELQCKIDDKHFIELSDYYLQLKQYTKYFPKENILLLDFDELKNDPQSVLMKTYEFLGISDAFFPEVYKVRNVTKPEASTVRKLRELRKTTLKPFFDMLPGFLKEAGVKVLKKAPAPQKRNLTDDERSAIYAELKENMLKLQNDYGFDVGKWGFSIGK